MYNLHLTPEQIEFRDTVRDFVRHELKPVVLHPDRLQAHDRRILPDLLRKASGVGLRTLALSEEAGGAGADSLTSCIVLEELAAGDVGIAVTLAETSRLAHLLFDAAMTPDQRARLLPAFLEDEGFHLALAASEHDTELGWGYHRPARTEAGVSVSAARHTGGDWVVNGTVRFVLNAPLASLIAVRVQVGGTGASVRTLLVARNTPGMTVRDHRDPAAHEPGRPTVPWYHGARGQIVFNDCHVPAANLIAERGEEAIAGESGAAGRGAPQCQAINLGVGRAACEAALEYAKLRVQGARPIVEHQAIGTILADIAIKLEVARSIVWRAAWASDHPDAYADGSLSGLPLQAVAKVYTSEAVHEAAEGAAECFGAMGVMRDMPLHRYIDDALIFIHSETSNSIARFRIAEALAGFRRPAPAHQTTSEPRAA
jgi:alkylation response protein AidB-like acyl-CoA dehydrogenase